MTPPIQPTAVGAYSPPSPSAVAGEAATRDAPDTVEREIVAAVSLGARLWRQPWVRRGVTLVLGAVVALLPGAVRLGRVAATHDQVDSAQQVQIDLLARRMDTLEARFAEKSRADLTRQTGVGRALCLLMTPELRAASTIPCPRITSGEDWLVEPSPLAR